MKEISQLEERLGVTFQDKALLLQALTHRSYINENPASPAGHNERLEFLGDAVVELIVTEHLYRKLPEKSEGELTSYRAALVNAEMFSGIARDLAINEHLLLSRGEKKDTGRARETILANTFEAVVGALYLDQGYAAAALFIERVLLVRIPEMMEKRLWKDPKSSFQEEAQERLGITPGYRVIRESGPDHQKRFVVGVYLGSLLVASGEGASKQEAEERAAAEALREKGWTS